MKKFTCALVLITIVVVLIIVCEIKKSSDSGVDIVRLNNMYTDIITLEDKISLYYLNYGYLPVNKERMTDFKDKSINPNDGEKYYEIDLTVLEDINLAFGKKESGEDDVYIVNADSHTVYYVKGVEYNGEEYFTRKLDYQEVILENYK